MTVSTLPTRPIAGMKPGTSGNPSSDTVPANTASRGISTASVVSNK